jgi:hypothetical protein
VVAFGFVLFSWVWLPSVFLLGWEFSCVLVVNHKTKQNQKQPHATHTTKITRGNYNRKKENRITVSSRIHDHNTCTPEDGQLGRNM